MMSCSRCAKIGAAALIAAVASLSPVGAEARKRKPQRPVERPYVRDCRPINGPDGYYSNPWCDGGFITLEEQEARYARGIRIYEGDRGRWYWVR